MGSQHKEPDMYINLAGRVTELNEVQLFPSFSTPRRIQPRQIPVKTEYYAVLVRGKEVIYRLGTLTLKGALPTGSAPAIAAIWLAEKRVQPGVYPPEVALEPEPFFKELEALGIPTKVTITRDL